jgi:DNA repair photolyase
VHGCAYCYIRGYSHYPGDDALVVYQNTATQVARELKRKRTRPNAVYFCPSSDAFMPIGQVLDQSYRTMKLLLDEGVGVQFVTKGAIPDRFFELFAQRPELVAGQVGLTTLDDRLHAQVEPHAAPAARRLDDLGRLVDIGATASLRADPLIHNVTDRDADLDMLFAKAARRGVRDVSASYLFLRPAIVGSLRRRIRDRELLRRILAPFDRVGRSPVDASRSGGIGLPAELRRAELARVRRLAARRGLATRLCGCKNFDITGQKCHLTTLTAGARAPTGPNQQAAFW